MRDLLRLTLGLVLLASSARAEDAPTDARRLHALLIGDTNDASIGESVGRDVDNVRRTLDVGVPEARYDVTIIQGDEATPAGILQKISALGILPTDSLFVYYAGHGAWYDGGHYLRMNDGKILERKDLRAAMQKSGARLAVLVTDCCSTYVGQRAYAQQPINDPDVFRDLFFRHRGLVDVTAAEKGQVAVGDEIAGGCFTRAFVDALTTVPRSRLDRNADGTVTWAELLPTVKVETETNFRGNQPRGLQLDDTLYVKQVPHVFQEDAQPIGGPIPASKERLGLQVKDVEGGVEVTGTHDGTPAAWAGFRPGERVVEVVIPGEDAYGEYREIQTAADLQAALDAVKGPQVMEVITHVPGEKDAEGEPKRNYRRVHLSR